MIYLQRTTRPHTAKHRKRAARRAGHTLSAVSLLPAVASRHLPGILASAVLLALAVGLSVWAVL